jgi:general secretion pathway protein L
LAESLLIRIPDTGVDRAEWAVLDEKGKLTGDVMFTGLGEVAGYAGGRRVTVVASGEDVVLMEAEVPTGNTAQARRAIPFSLEDNLADDVDDLHFAIGSQVRDKHYPVAVISRRQMDTLKNQCDEAGLHPTAIVPESLLIPLVENDEHKPWSAMLANGRIVMRQRQYMGFSVDSCNFGPMLDRALREAHDDAPQKLLLYNVGNTQKPSLPIDATSTSYDTVLEVLASGLSTPSINLLQGDYSHRRQLGKLWRPWKTTTILLGLLLLIWSSGSSVEYWQLGTREVQLDQQIVAVLKSAIPTARNTGDPAARMRLELKKLSQGGSDFLSTISEISRAISADRDLSLHSINYRDGRVDIELDATRLELFDEMKKRIDAVGHLTASIQSANKENNGVRGRVRIQGKR